MIDTTIVHYWLNGMRGGEKVVESIIDIFPKSKIITNIYSEKNISEKISKRSVKTTFINNLPNARKLYQYYLPLYPLALKMIHIDSGELVISSESGPAKGINVSNHIPHICYTHTPMRYIWDMQKDYFGTGIKRKFIQPIINYLQTWDYNTAQKVDYIIANSHYVKGRIKKVWNRNSIVIHPPVETKNITINNNVEDHYLLFGEHVKYKNSELAIEAFNDNGKKLIVMGGGEQVPYLKSMAKDNISILGRVNEETKRKYLSTCRALIFPGIEDFGIIPVEAMAYGRPVIAFKEGGATETVNESISGLFFNNQTVRSLNGTINHFEKIENQFISENIQNYSHRFDKSVFQQKFKDYVNSCIEDFKKTDVSKRR
jgi:glycosyltransferase involved in cell wall biosynthesis